MNPWILGLGVIAGALVAIEWMAAWKAGWRTHTPATTLSSLASGVGAVASGAVLSNALLYELVRAHLAWWQLPADSLWSWLVAVLALDFVSYWAHRTYHAVPVLWAMHAVHHQSHEFNMATGVRAPWLQPLMYAPFTVLLALSGVPGEVMGPVYVLLQVYKLLAHSSYQGHLGPLEWLLCTPRHHAVHHRDEPSGQHGNFGGFLLLWDQLFGTFRVGVGDARYGLGVEIPADPLHNNLEPWRALGRRLAQARSWGETVRALLWEPHPDQATQAWAQRR